MIRGVWEGGNYVYSGNRKEEMYRVRRLRPLGTELATTNYGHPLLQILYLYWVSKGKEWVSGGSGKQ